MSNPNNNYLKSQRINNPHSTLFENDGYNDNDYNNSRLAKIQKSLENIVSRGSQHQTPPAQNSNQNHNFDQNQEHTEIDVDDYLNLDSISEN
uniref:Uncharacterized protein n=1 Tax=Meloidogyne floridensis TaxID=298350 RepID=A0A915NNP2_9BILA